MLIEPPSAPAAPAQPAHAPAAPPAPETSTSASAIDPGEPPGAEWASTCTLPLLASRLTVGRLTLPPLELMPVTVKLPAHPEQPALVLKVTPAAMVMAPPLPALLVASMVPAATPAAVMSPPESATKLPLVT